MPREIAVKVIEDIIYRKQPFEHSFSSQLGQARSRLNSRDKAFAYLLISTTLRRLGQIDDLIGSCLDVPLTKKTLRVRTIMHVGVAQLLFLDVPPYAAVNTSVELAKKMKQFPYKKLINAVLRRLGREGASMLSNQDEAKLNTASWLWKSWTKAFGLDTCRKIALAHLHQAPLDLTIKCDAKNWAKKLSGQLLDSGSIRLFEYGMVNSLKGYEEGVWWVQDAAAALPVKLLGAIKGRRIADLCAAPGGKTAQLAAAGADVTALEKSVYRTAILEKNLIRLNLTAKIIVADAISWRPDTLFDAVLIDAPCTATGTIRRHPDIQYLKLPEDLTNLTATQKALLLAAVKMVKPKGIIIYATCSIQVEEGPNIIQWLINSGAPVTRYPISAAEIGGTEEFLTHEGDLRTLPCHFSEIGGIDGFFAARLVHN